MDVACNRCHAEYEFDDALISERGTTVFCTSCGFQFKVFPAERKGAPEEWTLTPALPGTRPRTFGSLRDLQRAILSGEVKETDLLARSGQHARALGSIAELEPLLKRPRSAPPPARNDDVPIGLGAAAPLGGQRRTAGGTVMGLAAPRVPNFPAEAPPAGSVPPAERASVTDAQRDSIDENAIVPPSPDPTGADRAKDEPWQAPPGQTLRPKIQSVLSRSPAAPPAVELPSAASGPPSSSRLRTALTHSTPPSTPRGRTGPAAPEFPSDPPTSRSSRFDSEPFSVIPGTHPRPLARGVWIVVSVLVGATAFVLTAARERVFALFDSGAREQSPHLISAERTAVAATELAEEAWLRVRMAPTEGRPAKEAVLEARLVALAQTLDESARGPLARTTAWTTARVHYLRMKGDVPAARAALGQAKGAPIVDPYLLATLDLADQSGQRPFASILRRLKEASSGERGRYRMRSAYIVALVEAGELAAAKEDFARLAQNGDAQNAPLYGDLEQFLARQEQKEPAATGQGEGAPGKAPPLPAASAGPRLGPAPGATEGPPAFGSSPPTLPMPGKAPAPSPQPASPELGPAAASAAPGAPAPTASASTSSPGVTP